MQKLPATTYAELFTISQAFIRAIHFDSSEFGIDLASGFT